MKGLGQFNHDVFGDTFYQISIVNGKKVAQVHSAALRWMERMAEEPACDVGSTALGDLLEFVQSQLLVVNLPQRLGSTRFDLELERQRTNSFDDPSPESRQTNAAPEPPSMDSLSISEQAANTDVPSFTFTPAEPNREVEDIRMPLQREPGSHGPTRCHASVFLDKLYDIDSEGKSSYWEADGRSLQPPTDLANPNDELTLAETIQSLDEYRRVSMLSLSPSILTASDEYRTGRLRIS